jgi:hypothetical protein
LIECFNFSSISAIFPTRLERENDTGKRWLLDGTMDGLPQENGELVDGGRNILPPMTFPTTAQEELLYNICARSVAFFIQNKLVIVV